MVFLALPRFGVFRFTQALPLPFYETQAADCGLPASTTLFADCFQFVLNYRNLVLNVAIYALVFYVVLSILGAFRGTAR